MKTISKIKTQRSQIRHFESTPSVSSCNNTLSLFTTTSFVPKRVRQEIWRSTVCSDATPVVFYHTRNNGQVIHGFMQLGVTLHWVVGHCHFFHHHRSTKVRDHFSGFRVELFCPVYGTALVHSLSSGGSWPGSHVGRQTRGTESVARGRIKRKFSVRKAHLDIADCWSKVRTINLVAFAD